MTEPTLNQSVEQIISALRQRPERHIKGALLGEQIKKIVPHLDLRKLMSIPAGPGTVSRFAEKYLNTVLAPAGKSGSDLVYEVIAKGESPTDFGHELWLTFARPGSEGVLSLDVSNGLGQATLSVRENLAPNHAQITSATHSELDKIRLDFTEEINASLEDKFQALDASKPYSEWSRQLKLIGSAQYKRWSLYRISKIIELFHERLAKLNVPLERRNLLDEELKKSQLRIRSPKVVSRPGEIDTSLIPTPHSHVFGEDSMRVAILEVIRNMPDSDLRLLKLPVGSLFDALQNTQKK